MAGKAGSGKDTSAEFMIESHGYQQVAFADNLKRLCMVVFGLTHDQCYDVKSKEKRFAKAKMLTPDNIEKLIKHVVSLNKFEVSEEARNKLYKHVGTGFVMRSPREVLQFAGTELLRESIRADYHLEVVRRRIEENGWKNVVITDARFENERAIIKKWGGKVVLVERKTKESDKGLKGHASENSLGDKSEYSHVLNNNGTLKDLECNVNTLMLEIEA